MDLFGTRFERTKTTDDRNDRDFVVEHAFDQEFSIFNYVGACVFFGIRRIVLLFLKG